MALPLLKRVMLHRDISPRSDKSVRDDLTFASEMPVA
jgi:hypothetical protein